MGKMRKKAAALDAVSDKSTLPLDDLSSGSLILENILSFLDTPSVKSCRLLSHKWDDAACPLLSKRTYFNIASFYESLYRSKRKEALIPRATLYSSWELTVEKGKNQFPSIYGADVKSFCILDIDISRKCIGCPRVAKIHFHFRIYPKTTITKRCLIKLDGNNPLPTPKLSRTSLS
jgi:hypothetical protein